MLVVDDVLATGGTARATVNLVQRLGGTVHAAAFLIELDVLKGRDKLRRRRWSPVCCTTDGATGSFRAVAPPPHARCAPWATLSGVSTSQWSARDACPPVPLVRFAWPPSALSDRVPVLSPPPAAAVLVTTSCQDAGPGSFRAAIDSANGDPAVTLVHVHSGESRTIALQSTVVFSGTQELTHPRRSAPRSTAPASRRPGISATGGGDLTVSDLTVRNAPAEGIAVEVPATATGTLRLALRASTILGNKGHGVLVNDQVDPATTDGVPPNPADRRPRLPSRVVNTRFIGNGYSVSDRDGLRVNEGGAGDLTITVRLVTADGNAADGIEVDERGPGDVRLDMCGARINGNGVFDPADLDDGFDIDESDDGSVDRHHRVHDGQRQLRGRLRLQREQRRRPARRHAVRRRQRQRAKKASTTKRTMTSPAAATSSPR